MTFRHSLMIYRKIYVRLTVIKWETGQGATVWTDEFIWRKREQLHVHWGHVNDQCSDTGPLAPDSTCYDYWGPLRRLFAFLDSVLVHLVLYLLEFVHGIQTVSPSLLLSCFAQFGLICKLLSRLHNFLLQGKSALQVPQEGILHKTRAGPISVWLCIHHHQWLGTLQNWYNYGLTRITSNYHELWQAEKGWDSSFFCK